MPISFWEEVAGETCCECGGPATHIYGTVFWCCECHGRDYGGGLFTREQAEVEHARILMRRAENGE